MSCYLCGHEETHHLGCVLGVRPDLTQADLIKLGFMPKPPEKESPPEHIEILKEGSMTTVPASNSCEFTGCDNPKYSDHPRVKFCEEHRDPKNRKE